jgi:hypothetical protein
MAMAREAKRAQVGTLDMMAERMAVPSVKPITSFLEFWPDQRSMRPAMRVGNVLLARAAVRAKVASTKKNTLPAKLENMLLAGIILKKGIVATIIIVIAARSIASVTQSTMAATSSTMDVRPSRVSPSGSGSIRERKTKNTAAKKEIMLFKSLRVLRFSI